jgi:hypothetical protein
MGLIDHRDPPSYTPSLERLKPLYNLLYKVLAFRGTKTVTDKPQHAVRVFFYHLLFHQGVPASFKVGFLAAGMLGPFIIIHMVSASQHQYKKDPFR